MLNIEQKTDEIIRSHIYNEHVKKSIRDSKIMVCFITESFMRDRRRKEHCDIAMEQNKIMYAVVKRGTRWRKFRKYPWRKIVYYDDESEIYRVMDELIKDANWIKTSGGV